jgi:hypothetical protein
MIRKRGGDLEGGILFGKILGEGGREKEETGRKLFFGDFY